MPKNESFSSYLTDLKLSKFSDIRTSDKIHNKFLAHELKMRFKNFIPVSSLQMIYNALIQPYFDYCSPLWDICGTQLLDKLQKFQNRAARIIVGASYETESAVVLETLGWETLKSRRRKMKSILLYKSFIT